MALSKQAKEIVANFDETTKLGDIKKLGKEIRQDHDLALELWSQGSHSSRLLSTLLFDKKLLTEPDLDALAADLFKIEREQRNQLGDWLLANQLSKDRNLVSLMESWQVHTSPIMRRWYWYYQARLRWTGRTPPEGSSAALLDAIEPSIATEDPDVQWVMNFCVGWIGIFEPELRSRCIALGKEHELYKNDPVAKNCTPSYLPEFIRIEVEKRES
ncbi:MAG: hypothetical protein DHS20C12_13570 [Pseudohongiella sp.]|nr:MAG: hypothetical protein DHS20C12_13570 [Pseudohongiella sp.]